MTDQNTAAGADAGKVAPTADDLSLIDDRLADASKDAADLWNEIRAGQREVSGETPAPATEPEEAAEAGDGSVPSEATEEPEEPGNAATEAQSDIWANATPAQRAELDRLRDEATRARNDAKAQSGRQAALQRRVNELQKMLQPRNDAAPKPKDALAGIAQDYPEIAEPLTKALEPIATSLAETETTRRQAAQDELAGIIEEQTNALLAKHDDYEKFLSDNAAAFNAWINDPRTPQGYVQAAHRNANAIVDADGAIAVMDAFKASLSPKPAIAPAPAPTPSPIPLNDRRQRQLDASASPRSAAGRPTVSGIPKEGDPQAIWDALRAEQRSQDRARA